MNKLGEENTAKSSNGSVIDQTIDLESTQIIGEYNFDEDEPPKNDDQALEIKSSLFFNI